MYPPIADQVIDFYQELFGRIFSGTFRLQIKERLRRNAVTRQVDEAADAASQSLIRFFRNRKLTEQHTAELLHGLAMLSDLLKIDDIANPNVTPEVVVDALLRHLPVPEPVRQADHEAIYRVALHSVVQVLMFVGPVMAEWRKLSFSSTFELPRRIVGQLNQISEQLDTLGQAGEMAADERYELTYRDYILQRFRRVEASTVRMTTNLDVDLPDLFVMPRVRPRSITNGIKGPDASEVIRLMDLEAARQFFGGIAEREDSPDENKGIPALEQVKSSRRLAIIGHPGSGKSTCLEWLLLKLASAEEELVMCGQQAIPLLLRLRQLDPRDLPYGAALIEKATASKDRAALMPADWIERQMHNGRVLLMLDGLDETEPDLRDKHVLPWLQNLCRQYPNCRYLVSSRPVGYPPGALRPMEFAECDLLDFQEPEIAEYSRHWCTAIRLARNEPVEEARRDGERIVESFRNHPYIRNLARNPLMLSAICLVNYFERGELPKERALLYRLCVEGLLHYWDQRRGIHSEFALDEKLRVCREVALAMQADDLAEYGVNKVQAIFADVLRDADRAEKLLEHIRYRTGLLLERRPGVFGFAHLTFQEYLAARAIHEGNRLAVGVERLVKEHDDGRWSEVIALYCGLAPSPAARTMIERLIAQLDTDLLSTVLAEAYLSAGPESSQDYQLRRRVLERIAIAPASGARNLERFPPNEIAPIANEFVGKIASAGKISESYVWFTRHDALDAKLQVRKLKNWQELSPCALCELVYLGHKYGSEPLLTQFASDVAIYESQGPTFPHEPYLCQAEIALFGLVQRWSSVRSSSGGDLALLQIFRVLSTHKESAVFSNTYVGDQFQKFLGLGDDPLLPGDASTWPELASLARCLATRMRPQEGTFTGERVRERNCKVLTTWANALERASAGEGRPSPAQRTGSRTSAKVQESRGQRKRGRHK